MANNKLFKHLFLCRYKQTNETFLINHLIQKATFESYREAKQWLTKNNYQMTYQNSSDEKVIVENWDLK